MNSSDFLKRASSSGAGIYTLPFKLQDFSRNLNGFNQERLRNTRVLIFYEASRVKLQAINRQVFYP